MTANHDQPMPPKKNVTLRVLIIVIILGLGFGVAVFLKKTAPVAQKMAPVKQAQLVETRLAERGSAQVSIVGYGQVVAARQITLKSQVAGQVTAVNAQFDIGACLSANSEVVQIDDRDYQHDVARQHAALQKAEAALAIEQGQQDVARREWLFYQQGADSAADSAALALREPYLRQAEAERLAAQAALHQAELALERTRIRVPFAALVLSKEVDLGAQLAAQGAVATLVATDQFWVEVVVAVDQLPWLAVPGVTSGLGAHAEVRLTGSDVTRSGQVIRLLGDLHEGGRMARLLVAIADPLDLQKPVGQRRPLLLGDHVEVTLVGRTLPEVVTVERALLRNGNQVWVATPQMTLSVRTVEIDWKDRESVYVSAGLDAGDALVVSDLPTAVDGMALRTAARPDSAEGTNR